MCHAATTLTCDHLTLNVCSISCCDVIKLCTKFERNQTIRDGVTVI